MTSPRGLHPVNYQGNSVVVVYVQDKLKVDVHRDKYLSALTRYSEERRKWRPCILAKILSTMVIMQDMYFSHSNIITNWKQRQEMTPLLYEVWEE